MRYWPSIDESMIAKEGILASLRLSHICSDTDAAERARPVAVGLGGGGGEAFRTASYISTGLGKRVVPRFFELAPRGQRESGSGIHAT